MLAVLPGGHSTLLYWAVTHPTAPIHPQSASQTTGFVATRMERSKNIVFERVGSGAGYDLLILAMDF